MCIGTGPFGVVMIGILSAQVGPPKGILIMAGLVAILIVFAVMVIVGFAVKICELEHDNADLHHRLLTAESVGETQALALRTVDALARASGAVDDEGR